MKKPSFYNREGYPSPTEYYAELHLMEEEKERQRELHKFRPMVYVCSPYAGDITRNTTQARRFSKFAVDEGFLPITPHLLFTQFLNDANPDEREIGMHMGLVLLTKCSELWVFGERISAGMQREIKKAQKRGIQIRYFNNECQEVVK